MTGQLQNLTVEVVDLLFDRLTRLEQRCDYSNQLGTILNQFLSSSSEVIELGTADNEAEILEQATDLVLEIALDLDQQCSAHQCAFTKWLSIALTRTSLNQPICMMRAIPAASLRSLLLICILSTAFA